MLVYVVNEDNKILNNIETIAQMSPFKLLSYHRRDQVSTIAHATKFTNANAFFENSDKTWLYHLVK